MSTTSKLRQLHRRLLPINADIGYAPYLWLFYLFFLLPGLYFEQWSALSIWATLVSVVVFLPLYFYGFRLSNSGEQIRNNLLIGLLGILLLPINSSAGVYFIYAAAGCGFIRNIRVALAIIIGLAVVLVLQSWLLGYPIFAIIMPAAILLIVACANLFQAEIMRKNRTLRRSQAEVSHLATVAERERISRDLHDLLGHSLSLITLKAELAGKLLARDDSDRARQEVADLERISRAALSEVREAVTGYRQAGLEDELRHAAEALQSADIKLELQTELQTLPAAYDNTLAMCVREAVTNVIRHADAGLCRIELSQHDNQIRLTISDDGKPNQHQRSGDIVMGSGLQGMRDRLAGLDGRLRIVQENGLRLEIELPLTTDSRPQSCEQPDTDHPGWKPLVTRPSS